MSKYDFGMEKLGIDKHCAGRVTAETSKLSEQSKIVESKIAPRKRSDLCFGSSPQQPARHNFILWLLTCALQIPVNVPPHHRALLATSSASGEQRSFRNLVYGAADQCVMGSGELIVSRRCGRLILVRLAVL
jgi:hypothetical protein